MTVDDDIEDENNNSDNIDHGIDDDIINSNDDDVDGDDGPNGADSVFMNQVEEWEEAIDNEDYSNSGSPCCGDKCPHSSTLAVLAR